MLVFRLRTLNVCGCCGASNDVTDDNVALPSHKGGTKALVGQDSGPFLAWVGWKRQPAKGREAKVGRRASQRLSKNGLSRRRWRIGDGSPSGPVRRAKREGGGGERANPTSKAGGTDKARPTPPPSRLLCPTGGKLLLPVVLTAQTAGAD